MPKNAVISFTLVADDEISPILEAYKRKKIRNDIPIVKEAAEELCRFFEAGSEGLANMAGIPVRHFRLFVSFRLTIQSSG